MSVAADMTMPDGNTITVRGASRKDVIAKAKRMAKEVEAMPTIEQSQGLTIGEFGARRFLNNLMALPSATGDMLALGGAGLETVGQSISGDNEQGFLDRFRANFENQKQQLPASALRSIPRPEFKDIQAGIDTAVDVASGRSESVGQSFAENQVEQSRRLEALRQQQPFATGAGDVAGDAATIFTGRMPFAKSRQAGARTAREGAERAEEASRIGLSASSQKKLNDVVTGTIIPALRAGGQKFTRGAGKAGEAGLEGATLAILNEGDPISTGMWSAGAQSAASLPLFAMDEFVRAPMRSIGTGALAFSLWQLYGPDSTRILESTETSIKKAGAGLAVGAAAGLFGAGRLRGRVMENYPKFADAVTSVPRGAALSLIEDLNNSNNDGDTAPTQILEKFSTDPAFFTPTEQRALGKAIMSEKPGAWRKEVDRLLKKKSFREKFNE